MISIWNDTQSSSRSRSQRRRVDGDWPQTLIFLEEIQAAAAAQTKDGRKKKSKKQEEEPVVKAVEEEEEEMTFKRVV
jgi:hypothetical protein